MSDNPWTAEVHMEAGTNGTDHAVWLYERQTYIAKPVHGSIEKCERFAARINGTNQPIYAVRADLLDDTETIRHWLVGRTVDSVGLAAELRQWADTFQPTDLPDGVSPWLGDEADAVALGRIVQTLPDDEWERAHGHTNPDWHSTPNALAVRLDVYLLRRKPQTVTVELPKDVAEQLAEYGDGWLGGCVGETTEAACRKALGR